MTVIDLVFAWAIVAVLVAVAGLLEWRALARRRRTARENDAEPPRRSCCGP